MHTDELLCRIALSMMPIKPQLQAQLLSSVGSATELYHLRNSIADIMPDASAKAAEIFSTFDTKLEAARRELAYDQAHNIKVITIADESYPQRLRQTEDAPTVLYSIGNIDYNTQHTVAIVGTRNCTSYGVDMCRQFISELHEMVPDILVFSGLAYGMDITAHRRCIELNIPNVAVLANGLDTIYPTAHRREANLICSNGALLSEYPVGTEMTKYGFVARNRIIAGCCDATVVVESKEKGGSLHTANLAFDYQREVYTFPGRITDRQSHGCIDLVYRNIATLIRSAEQFVKSQQWADDSAEGKPVQTELFTSFNENEMKIINTLRETSDSMHVDLLTTKTCIPLTQLRSALLSLEMQAVIDLCPGNRYRLTNRFR